MGTLWLFISFFKSAPWSDVTALLGTKTIRPEPHALKLSCAQTDGALPGLGGGGGDLVVSVLD